MPLNYNGNSILNINYNNTPLAQVTYNGVTVWQSVIDAPNIKNISSTYNSISFNVQNMSSYSGVTIYATVNGVTFSNTNVGSNGTATDTTSFSFNYGNANITSNVTYSVTAYAVAGSLTSGTTTTNTTTPLVRTTDPVVSNVSSTLSSVSFNLKNDDDDASAYVYAKVCYAGTTTQVSGTNTINVLLGVNATSGTQTINGLAYNTAYDIKAHATTTNGKLVSLPDVNYSFTTPNIPTSPVPSSISVYNSTASSIGIKFYCGSTYRSLDYEYNLSGRTGSGTTSSDGSGYAYFTISSVSASEYSITIRQKRSEENWSTYSSGVNCLNSVIYNFFITDNSYSYAPGEVIIGYCSNPYYVQVWYYPCGSLIYIDCALSSGGGSGVSKTLYNNTGTVYYKARTGSCSGAEGTTFSIPYSISYRKVCP